MPPLRIPALLRRLGGDVPATYELQFERRAGHGYRPGMSIRFNKLLAGMPSPVRPREPRSRGICAIRADFHIMENEIPFYGIHTRMHIR
jgi:hypothetical protein